MSAADADEHEARTTRLLAIPPDQIAHYSVETILDWLDARREWRSARLREACRVLRDQLRKQERAHARIAAAVHRAASRTGAAPTLENPMTDTSTAALARIRQMTDYWEQHLPEVIRTPAVVSALRAAMEPAVVEPPADQTALRARRERYAVALYNTLETSPFHTPWEELGPLRRTVWYARAEAAMAVADAEHAVVEPPADRAALRDRIAEAVEQLHQTGAVYALGAGEAGRIADAVLAVLSEAADRAAVLREEADRIDATRADFPIAVQNGITWATAELRRHATECPQCGTTGACNGGPCPLRRMADETATTGTQPETCAHCGQPISRITGTLTAWWVHDPGGNTICHPEQAASSTRATPKPAAEAECTCAHAGASFAPAGHYADCPAAGARQDGAQS